MSIPTISVTVELPVREAGRIAAAYCATRGYGPTDAADAVRYVREGIIADLYRQTLEYEAALAASAARDAVFGNASDPLAQAAGPAPAEQSAAATGPTGGAGVGGGTGPATGV